jgi:peptidoglycan hydrolase-like protein with peptidoglycan-binding domain
MALRSTRFAGDRELEACANGAAVLRIGAAGPSVQKVQQALIDLGLTLPRFGADGKYGHETSAAVQAFQRSKSLQVDGRVGKDTMGALDREFAPRRAGELPQDGLGSGLPPGFHWGVDTTGPATFTIKTGGTTKTLLDLVVEVAGTVPEFWGRYLFSVKDQTKAVTLAEANFLFRETNGICRVLPIANFADVVYQGSRDAGRNNARTAANTATQIGVPSNVWIYTDIEPTALRFNPEWFIGWWEGMFAAGHRRGRGGIYEVTTQAFLGAYRAALKATLDPLQAALNPNPAVFLPDPPAAARLLWAQRPFGIPPGSNINSPGVKPAGQVPFKPDEPAFCPGMTVLWQYGLKFFLIPGNRNSTIDMSIAKQQAFQNMWHQ